MMANDKKKKDYWEAKEERKKLAPRHLEERAGRSRGWTPTGSDDTWDIWNMYAADFVGLFDLPSNRTQSAKPMRRRMLEGVFGGTDNIFRGGRDLESRFSLLPPISDGYKKKHGQVPARESDFQLLSNTTRINVCYVCKQETAYGKLALCKKCEKPE